MNNIIEKNFSNLSQEFTKMYAVVVRQFELVKQMLDGATDEQTIQEVRANEKTIDRYEVLFREEIINTIVRQTPRARDLRRIISFFDIIIDLERVCDLLNGIHKRLPIVIPNGSIYTHYYQNIVHLYGLSEKMVQNAVFAFECENSEIARNVIHSDDEVDELHAQIYKDMLSFDNIDKREPKTIESLLILNRIAHSIERIGDAATNISEAVVFLVEGIDIKHAQ